MSCWPLKVLSCFNPTHGLIRLLETDDAANWAAFGQHVDNLNACALHVMHHGIYAGRKITVGDKCRCCYDEPGGSRQQTFVNATGKLCHRRITSAGGDRSESVDHPSDGSKQSEQRRQESNCSKHEKKPLQLWDFELRGFLHDVA